MLESLPVSQLTMMKLPSSGPTKCTVFCDFGTELAKFSILFHDETSVEGLISETIRLMKETSSSQPIPTHTRGYALFASKKNGRKISDLPSFEPKQKIALTGVKAFYLSPKELENSTKRNTLTASTKSIQSDIMEMAPKRQEIKASKQIGCFCFSK